MNPCCDATSKPELKKIGRRRIQAQERIQETTETGDITMIKQKRICL